MIISINSVSINVNDLTTAQIIQHYNDMAFELGETPVTRFANRTKAESRLVGIADRHANFLATRPAAKVEEPTVGSDTVPVKAEPVQLTESDTQQVKAEAAIRRAVKTLEVGGPRWARPKQEAASKVAYRPRAGSSQSVMYGLLTLPGGINIHMFCEEMKQFKDKTLHQPATVWSCLRYLFVTSKGYGLTFDGSNIALVVPADERDAVRVKQEASA